MTTFMICISIVFALCMLGGFHVYLATPLASIFVLSVLAAVPGNRELYILGTWVCPVPGQILDPGRAYSEIG